MTTDNLVYQVPDWWTSIVVDDTRIEMTKEKATQLVVVYVPESDMLSFGDALELALKRDEQAAMDLRLSWEAAV